MSRKITDVQSICSEVSTVFEQASVTDDSVLYERTKRLLELYRLCVWTLNFSANDIKSDLLSINAGTDTSPALPSQSQSYEALLAAAEQRGFDLYGTWISRRIKSISKTAVLLNFMDSVHAVVASYPYSGNIYHQILQLNYFDTKDTSCTGRNVSAMRIMNYTNEASYFKHKKEAIALYSKIFWNTIDDRLVLTLSGSNCLSE